MKVLMRKKDFYGDKIFLKPLTFEEYQEKVRAYYDYIEDEVNYFAKHREHLDTHTDEFIERMTNFFIMPIPANGFQAKDIWVNATSLQKYRI